MNRKRDFLWLAVCLIVLAVAVLFAGKQQAVNRTITDVSWPNCKLNPDAIFQQGIIGVTGGLDFHPNPCLTQETAWFGRYALYMNTGYPGPTYGRKFLSTPKHCSAAARQCLAYNYGFHAAEYGLGIAAHDDAYTDLWWLDVETDNSWTNNPAVNRAVLAGAIAAIQQGSLFSEVGIYSTPNQWHIITDDWKNKLPVWLATGAVDEQSAAHACSQSAFTGGSIWLSQYTEELDGNVACSGAFPQRLVDVLGS